MCAVIRCKIAECDDDHSRPPNWIPNAIPNDGNKCEMYDRVDDYHLHFTRLDSCSAEAFNKSHIVVCNDFVFDTEEVNILNEVCLFVCFTCFQIRI